MLIVVQKLHGAVDEGFDRVNRRLDDFGQKAVYNGARATIQSQTSVDSLVKVCLSLATRSPRASIIIAIGLCASGVRGMRS